MFIGGGPKIIRGIPSSVASSGSSSGSVAWKEVCRVVTTGSVVLAGGAPNVVDSVSLLVDDRILVPRQSTSSQDGIYRVTVTGSGGNGTWVRTDDADTTADFDGGFYVRVAEGDLYRDQLWFATVPTSGFVLGTTGIVIQQSPVGYGLDNYVGPGPVNRSFVGGGQGNQVQGVPYGTIAGGLSNVVSATRGAIVGGVQNTVSGDNGFVGGGLVNTASGTTSSVGGGDTNTSSGARAHIGGGASNVSSGMESFVGGGSTNAAAGQRSFIGGGDTNSITTNGGINSFIGGGNGNTITGPVNSGNCFIGGGLTNAITTGGNNLDRQTICGGTGNIAGPGHAAFVGGGSSNTAAGAFSVVPGGLLNEASADYSHASGRRAKANHTGAFVWADSQNADFASAAVDEFVVRAAGGARWAATHLPNADATYDLGSNLKRWNVIRGVTVTAGDLELGFDDSDGQWTVKEGADTIFAINRRTGKKYRLAMEEVS